MNLTELQINYILVDALKGENRKGDLIRIFQELENKKLKHDNINKYILEYGEYKAISTKQYIELYQNGCIKETFYKWNYKTLYNRVIADLYYIEYIELKNEFKTLYNTQIFNNWVNKKQYETIKKAAKLLNLYCICRIVKQDKQTGKVYAIFEREYTHCIKDNKGINYIMGDIDPSKSSRLEVLKNKIDLEEVKKLLAAIKEMKFIKLNYFISIDKKDKSELKYLCTDRITADKEILKDYYNKNVFNKCDPGYIYKIV